MADRRTGLLPNVYPDSNISQHRSGCAVSCTKLACGERFLFPRSLPRTCGIGRVTCRASFWRGTSACVEKDVRTPVKVIDWLYGRIGGHGKGKKARQIHVRDRRDVI